MLVAVGKAVKLLATIIPPESGRFLERRTAVTTHPVEAVSSTQVAFPAQCHVENAEIELGNLSLMSCHPEGGSPTEGSGFLPKRPSCPCNGGTQIPQVAELLSE
jgi:hypothetical protein